MPDYGLMDDGMMPYWPGINCMTCGRFVGRDGHIAIDYFEMSSTIASIEGECRVCLSTAGALREMKEWGDQNIPGCEANELLLAEVKGVMAAICKRRELPGKVTDKLLAGIRFGETEDVDAFGQRGITVEIGPARV